MAVSPPAAPAILALVPMYYSGRDPIGLALGGSEGGTWNAGTLVRHIVHRMLRLQFPAAGLSVNIPMFRFTPSIPRPTNTLPSTG